MVANKNLLRWVGASFVLVNLVMLVVWGWEPCFCWVSALVVSYVLLGGGLTR